MLNYQHCHFLFLKKIKQNPSLNLEILSGKEKIDKEKWLVPSSLTN